MALPFGKRMNKFSIGFFIVAVLFLTGCLDLTETPREPNLFSLSITVPNAGADFILGNDTITVFGFKMIIDTLSVRKVGGEDERFAPQLLLASYVFGFSEYYTVGTGPLGGGTFYAIRYSVVRPSPFTTSLNDADLVERDSTGQVIDTYSIAVTGVYNRTLFRFRSKISRAVEYGFLNNVQLPEANGYLEARLRGNWNQWFLSFDSGEILDPNDPANRDQIETNLLKHFDILTIAFGEVR
jgi:hypothetical protein